MLFKPFKLAFTTALLAGSTAVLAVPFNSFDPRSMGMGGAGVAVGDAAMAPFFNPALLAVTKDKDDFSMDVPIIGVRAYDPSDFKTSLDNFQKGGYVNTLQTSINTFNGAGGQTSANLTAIANNVSTLSTQLATLSDKPIQGELGAGLVIGIPSKKIGGAFYVDGWSAVGGVIKYKDGQTLQGFSTAMTDVANCYAQATPALQAACIVALPAADKTYFNTTNGQVTFNTNTNLQSSVDIRGVVLTEAGLALSREFTTSDKTWAFGITPKVLKATLFDYSASVNSGSTSNAKGNDYIAKYSDMNFDLGVAKNYNNGWRTGLVLKNIIPRTYDFKSVSACTPAGAPGTTPCPTGATMSLKPQARIGASRQNNWSTVAMDLDLTSNDPAGLEKKSQYLALGAELDAWGWAQLRLGYRANLADSKRNIASIGFGLAPFTVVHLDLAVAKSSNEVGGSFQFGVKF